MDTKLKDIKYAMGTKTLAVVLVWLFFMSAAGSAVFLLFNHNNVQDDSYFDTNKFNSQFSDLTQEAIELNLVLKSEENIKLSGGKYGSIRDNLNRFQYIKSKLANSVNFAYYIKNSQTGDVITNMKDSDPVSLIRKQTAFEHYSSGEAEMRRPMYTIGSIRQMLAFEPYEVYVAVIEPLKPGDAFYNDFISFSNAKTQLSYATAILIASIILMVFVFAYLVYVAGRQEKGGKLILTYIDRLYTDFHTVMVFIAAVLSVLIVIKASDLAKTETIIVASIVLGIDALIGISYVLSMVRQIKIGMLFRNTLIYAGFAALRTIVKLCFNGRLFKASTLLLLVAYGILNGILIAMGTHIHRDYQIPIVFTLFLGFNIAAVYFTAKSLSSLTQIMEGVREISNGNMDYSLEVSEMSAAFSGFGRDIESIQGGLKKAVAEAVKGERMKTDLIANVSHDLKTPLTSIISYVDLLKKESLNNNKAEEYVSILEEKSARLKQLIEDLIEASKASSGNLAVSVEKVDLHELIMQACGEYEEKIKTAALDIRINDDGKNTAVFADGKYMWRILENLLSNTVKYSMPDSRVYVNISKSGSYGKLTLKNISAFPLDISPEQLTERFVRGDVSRTTEGSGLGLSIAKSLTELQGGRFKIEIDGDLFKVTVEMPLWSEK